MAKIGAHVDQDTVRSKFFPEFRRLSKDKSWEVRRAFVDNAVALASFLPIQLRGKEFCFLFHSILNDDNNRWVREATLKQLGHVLSLLNHEYMNEGLFNKYLKVPS